MIDTELLKNHNLILASQSPRRRELIKGLDIEVQIAPSYEVEEIVGNEVKSKNVAEVLSLKKSMLYPFELKSNDILITSDTTVCIEEKVLGKPKDKADAMAMLTMLSGQQHTVITAVTLRCGQVISTFSQSTIVKFKPLSSEDIEYYIDNYKPYDKAGAYAIQQWIGYIAIESITGSFYNVMGLPVCKLYKELGNFIKKLK